MLVGFVTMDADEVVRAEQFLHEELEQFSMVGEWFDLSVEFINKYLPDFFLTHGFGVLT